MPKTTMEQEAQSILHALAKTPDGLNSVVYGLVRRLADTHNIIGPNSLESLRTEAQWILPHLPAEQVVSAQSGLICER